MKKIYLIRHAESQANAHGILAGSDYESPLTEEGKKQAREAGQYLKDKNIECIVASPMERTRHTAEIIAREIGVKQVDVLTHPLLTERAFGFHDGKPYKEYAEATRQGRLIGVETTEALHARVEKMYEWLAKRPEKVILVVSHGSTCRMFRIVDQELHHNDFRTIGHFNNAEIDEFTL